MRGFIWILALTALLLAPAAMAQPTVVPEWVEQFGSDSLQLFNGMGNQEAMLEILAEIEMLIAAGEIRDAVGKVGNLQRRTDGCDGWGGDADNNDWVLNCFSQVPIQELFAILFTNLQA